MYDNEKWLLSPAYDLIYTKHILPFYGISINQKHYDPTNKDILAVANKANLNPFIAKNIIKEVQLAANELAIHINEWQTVRNNSK
jgi:hypothetical protein